MSKQKCILIYDDDSEILMLCGMILKSENYRIETCKICDNIIDDVKSLRPDVILIDLWIPKIGGEEAIRQLRVNPELKNIPVLLFSANDEIEKISKKTQAHGFVQKPFDVKTLKNEIEKWI